MLKKTNLIVLVSFLFFLIGCSDDTSLSALESSATDIILDDGGEVLDEAPISEEEQVADIIDTPIEEDLSDDEDEIDPPVNEEPPVVVIDPPVIIDPPIVIKDPPLCIKRRHFKLAKLDGSGESLDDIVSFAGSIPSKVNYNYYSWSAHPLIGVNPGGYEGHFYLYEGSDGMSFNFFYNVDAAGSPDNTVKMDVIIKGNNQKDKIIISDDKAEVKRIEQADGSSLYEAKMRYWKNTDGGVLGPIKGDDFKVYVKIYFVGDNKNVVFHSSDGRSINLEGKGKSDLFSEFELTFSENKEDCSSLVKEENRRNQCIAKIYESRKEAIKETDWFEVIAKLQQDRRDSLKSLRAEQLERFKASQADYKEKISELSEAFKKARDTYREVRKDKVKFYASLFKKIRQDFRQKLKGLDREGRAKLKAEDRVLVQKLRKERKSFLEELRKNFLEKRASFAAERKEIVALRKDALAKLRVQMRTERRDLAAKLLKDLRAKRAELMKMQGQVHRELEVAVRGCYK